MASTVTHYEIDIEHEKMLPLGELPAIVAKMGFRKPHVCAVRRWTQRGVKGLLLPSLLMGDRRYTSMEALRWWVAATSAVDRSRSAPAAAEPATQPDIRYPVKASTRRYLEKHGLITPGQKL